MSPRPPATPRRSRSIISGLPTPPATPSASPNSSFGSSPGKDEAPVTPTRSRTAAATRRGRSAWSTPRRQIKALKPTTLPKLVYRQPGPLGEDVPGTASAASKLPVKTQSSMRDGELQISRWVMLDRVHHRDWPPAEDLVLVAERKNRNSRTAAGKEKKEWKLVLGRACVGLETEEAVSPLLELAGAPKQIRDEMEACQGH